MGPDSFYRTVNIDIGTAGMTDGLLKEDALLITFDPFDSYLKRPGHERLPYVVAHKDGKVNFIVNHLYPQCSSLSQINPHARAKRPKIACSTRAFKYFQWCINTSKLEVKEVQGIRLSTFLRRRSFNKINTLKIDAQGSDFAILQDVLEMTPQVRVDHIVLECQDYKQTNISLRLYVADNDCRVI